MADQQQSQQSNGPLFCRNKCGFFGNPSTLNLCSKCYRLHTKSETHVASSIAKTTSSSLVSPALSSSTDSVIPKEKDVVSTTSCRPSRCSSCKKRVGLTGFKCRCGATYCGTHIYPEMHSCSFDFKAAGKEAIAKANPLIKAAKLENML